MTNFIIITQNLSGKVDTKEQKNCFNEKTSKKCLDTSPGTVRTSLKNSKIRFEAIGF